MFSSSLRSGALEACAGRYMRVCCWGGSIRSDVTTCQRWAPSLSTSPSSPSFSFAPMASCPETDHGHNPHFSNGGGASATTLYGNRRGDCCCAGRYLLLCGAVSCAGGERAHHDHPGALTGLGAGICRHRDIRARCILRERCLRGRVVCAAYFH